MIRVVIAEENVANARPVVKLLSPGFMRARDTKAGH